MPSLLRSTSTPSSPPSFPLALDRVAIAFMVALSLLIGIVLWGGDRTAPWVREFSWQGKQIGADDTAFLLTFSRPMDHASVESHLRIEPKLDGKFSWAGRRMAYTLTMPAPYGTNFQVQIEGANDRFNGAHRTAIKPFVGQFRSRDRAFAYIGVEGEETGRLVLYNLNQQQKQILTSKELVVMDFKPYPLGDRLLFAATSRADQSQGILGQQLYTVTTGIHVDPPAQLDSSGAGTPTPAAPTTEAPGKVDLVLDNAVYQNLRFDLSADGQIIVVQRVNRNDPADFGPWLLKVGEPPKPLKGQPGGDFLITPDSNSLAIAQGQGLAILPLQPDAKPLNFLPKFGIVLSFSQDGSLAAMVKFNTDQTRSLFLVSSQGTQKQLLKTTGSILNARFDPTKQFLYCLLTELNTQGDLYREEPYLAVIDLKTSKLSPLLRLPDQRDVQVSLAPDGLALLFDQTIHSPQADPNEPLRDSSGKAIANSRLWLLPLTPTAPASNLQPEALPLPGLRPRWLP